MVLLSIRAQGVQHAICLNMCRTFLLKHITINISLKEHFVSLFLPWSCVQFSLTAVLQ